MKPICPYFGQCGGCLYQDLDTNTYLEKKKNYIMRCFSDYGLQPVLSDIISIPIHSRRRATFAYHKGHFGFNAYKSHHIIDIDNCPLLTNNLCNIILPLRTLMQHLNTTADIHVLDTPFGIDIHIKTKNQKDKPSLHTLELLASFIHTHAIARLSFNHNPIGETTKLPFPPDSFLQPSIAGEQALINLMMEHIGSSKNAIDLFCGSGTFTKPLLQAGIRTTGYDNASDSIKALGQNGIFRDLFRNPLMPNEFNDIDLVVIDPPRSGAIHQIEQLAQTNVPNIIMISCNPSTCARDINVLINNGWVLSQITPVDQFTYSNHIELVCVLSKNNI